MLSSTPACVRSLNESKFARKHGDFLSFTIAILTTKERGGLREDLSFIATL
jgi:hypothetical protein